MSNKFGGSPRAWGVNNPTLQWDVMQLVKGALTSYVAFKPKTTNEVGRVYILPDGVPAVGTVTAALKVFGTDYTADQNNYQDYGMYADASTGFGSPFGAGTFFLNSKVNGDYFGFNPQIAISRTDGAAIPFRMVTTNRAVSNATAATFAASFKGNWKTGKVYAIGDTVCASTGKAYQATTAGTSGVTKPSHAAGTVSDGGVSWLFLWDNAAGAGADIKSFAVAGNFGSALWWTDATAYNSTMHFADNTCTYPGISNYYLSSAGVALARLVQNGTSLYVSHPTNITAALRFDFSAAGSEFAQYVGLARLLGSRAESSLSATPSVAGTEQLVFGNASPTTVTSFANGKQYQRIYLRSGNGQTTIQHNATTPGIRLNTGANKVLTANACLELVADAAGTVFVEVGTL
jgi:hypothetical protein